MTWERTIKMNPGPMFPSSNTNMAICNATSCFWNRNKSCRQAEIRVGEKGECIEYKET